MGYPPSQPTRRPGGASSASPVVSGAALRRNTNFVHSISVTEQFCLQGIVNISLMISEMQNYNV